MPACRRHQPKHSSRYHPFRRPLFTEEEEKQLDEYFGANQNLNAPDDLPLIPPPLAAAVEAQPENVVEAEAEVADLQQPPALLVVAAAAADARDAIDIRRNVQNNDELIYRIFVVLCWRLLQFLVTRFILGRVLALVAVARRRGGWERKDSGNDE